MTRADSSTSGMKHSPSRMRWPTTSMPGSSASSKISRAEAPPASRALVIAVATAASPSMMACLRGSFICSSLAHAGAVTPTARSVSSTIVRTRCRTSSGSGSG